MSNKQWLNLGKKLRKGDKAAYTEIFDLFADKIYRFIFLKVKSEDAEDLVELTFIKLWENHKSYDYRKSNLQTWLFTIARNVVIDYYRAYKETVELSKEVLETTASDQETSTQLEMAFTQEALQEALQELSESHREVIILRYVEELDYKEIADIMGKSSGAVRVLQMRALGNLKEIISQSGFQY